VDTVLEIFENVRVPSVLPPIYPTDSDPEHPEQDITFAPPVSTLLDDSASGVVSVGPVAQVLADTSRIQFTAFD
jgi:hypothetical protein